MRYIDKKQKMEYLLELINKEVTGAPESLCTRIVVSKRTLFRYLDHLEEEGYSLEYCKNRKTYFMKK
jgi:DNA-binding IclR family transcriptional regulator